MHTYAVDDEGGDTTGGTGGRGGRKTWRGRLKTKRARWRVGRETCHASNICSSVLPRIARRSLASFRSLAFAGGARRSLGSTRRRMGNMRRNMGNSRYKKDLLRLHGVGHVATVVDASREVSASPEPARVMPCTPAAPPASTPESIPTHARVGAPEQYMYIYISDIYIDIPDPGGCSLAPYPSADPSGPNAWCRSACSIVRGNSGDSGRRGCKTRFRPWNGRAATRVGYILKRVGANAGVVGPEGWRTCNAAAWARPPTCAQRTGECKGSQLAQLA